VVGLSRMVVSESHTDVAPLTGAGELNRCP
jgi:hypothetical protein